MSLMVENLPEVKPPQRKQNPEVEKDPTTSWGLWIQFSLRLLDIHVLVKPAFLTLNPQRCWNQRSKRKQKRGFQVKSNTTAGCCVRRRCRVVVQVHLDTESPHQGSLLLFLNLPRISRGLSLKSSATSYACFNKNLLYLKPWNLR